MVEKQDWLNALFQFTPLREGRQKYKEKIGMQKIFQFTPLREGRRRSGWRTTPLCCDFNSRPSARGDLNRQCGRMTRLISIHAPPRGATIVIAEGTHEDAISIHAPPRGATAGSACNVSRHHFNSRPSARGDRMHRIPL
mgnify:CR=1 FL=1